MLGGFSWLVDHSTPLYPASLGLQFMSRAWRNVNCFSPLSSKYCQKICPPYPLNISHSHRKKALTMSANEQTSVRSLQNIHIGGLANLVLQLHCYQARRGSGMALLVQTTTITLKLIFYSAGLSVISSLDSRSEGTKKPSPTDQNVPDSILATSLRLSSS